MMFGKKARKELKAMISKLDRIAAKQVDTLERIDTLKELERMWQERDALEDANERLTAEYDQLATEAKKLADRNWKMEQKIREYEVKAECRTES